MTFISISFAKFIVFAFKLHFPFKSYTWRKILSYVYTFYTLSLFYLLLFFNISEFCYLQLRTVSQNRRQKNTYKSQNIFRPCFFRIRLKLVNNNCCCICFHVFAPLLPRHSFRIVVGILKTTLSAAVSKTSRDLYVSYFLPHPRANIFVCFGSSHHIFLFNEHVSLSCWLFSILILTYRTLHNILFHLKQFYGFHFLNFFLTLSY